MNIHRYETMLPHELEAELARAPVAYLALGTLEYHGPHLPVGNDALKAEAILERACAHTGGVMVPTLYWGIGGGHKEYPTSVIVRDPLLGELLDDILEGLYRNGFRIFVLLTGHYPKEQVTAVKEAAARLRQAHPQIQIWALPEYEAFPREFRGDHAAKWETSILQYLRPELVDMSQIHTAALPEAPDATRSLDEMNVPGPLHGILGENPAKTARPELGEETVIQIVEQITAWVNQALRKIQPFIRIEKSRRALLQALQGLSEAEMSGPAVEGIWTVKDVLGHITAWESACLQPLESFVGGGAFQSEAIPDHDAWNAIQAAQRQAWSLTAVREELHAVRGRLLAAASRLSNEQWAVPLQLPWGEQGTTTDMLSGLAWHEEEHLKNILSYFPGLLAGHGGL